MATSCPANPPAPQGFTVWKGAVPAELVQWAIDLRNHVASYPYGTVWQMAYNGQTVAARKDYHTWTWRNGVLVTGICIPGITLYSPLPAGTVGATAGGDPLANPDGTEAVFGADDGSQPSTGPNWGLVIGSGVALAGVVTLFALAMKYGGHAALNPAKREMCGPDSRGQWVHRGGCRPGRPHCRVSRRIKGICTCTAAHYPHRSGWCRLHGEVPEAIRKSPSYKRVG